MIVKDLGDLTYEETVLCLVRLMYIKHQSRWIDVSLCNLLGDWLRRIEERFAGVNGKLKQSILQSYTLLDDPEPFVAMFLGTYPEACEQLLAAEDKKYFLSIAQHPGQKLVPFIPVLDAVRLSSVTSPLLCRHSNLAAANVTIEFLISSSPLSNRVGNLRNVLD